MLCVEIDRPNSESNLYFLCSKHGLSQYSKCNLESEQLFDQYTLYTSNPYSWMLFFISYVIRKFNQIKEWSQKVTKTPAATYFHVWRTSLIRTIYGVLFKTLLILIIFINTHGFGNTNFLFNFHLALNRNSR